VEMQWLRCPASMLFGGGYHHRPVVVFLTGGMLTGNLFALLSSMILGCIASSNTGLRDYNILSWIYSFSSLQTSPLRIPPFKWYWRLVD